MKEAGVMTRDELLALAIRALSELTDDEIIALLNL